jgi:hypothetical protein
MAQFYARRPAQDRPRANRGSGTNALAQNVAPWSRQFARQPARRKAK